MANVRLIILFTSSVLLPTFERPTVAAAAGANAQAAGGHGPERKQRIDWMYEGPMQTSQDQQAEADEYLMGKKVRAS